MRESDLPSPNIGARGYHLRRIAAQAISQLEVVAPAYGGTHPDAADLSNFFSDCKAGVFPMLAAGANVPVDVSNGTAVHVLNSAGADSHTGTAAVASGALSGVKLPATVAMVDNADTVAVQNSAGTAVAGTHAATVAAGVLSNVKLAATVAPVVNGAVLTVPVTGTYATKATLTVANGVVTGIVLS